MKRKITDEKTILKISIALFIVLSIFYIVQVRNFYGIIKTEIEQKEEIRQLKMLLENTKQE